MTSQTMNRINELQNEEENLLLLFSQKILYDDAKKFKFITFIINILIFIIGIASKQFTGDDTPIVIVSGILFFIGLLTNQQSTNSNGLAAATQAFVDRKIYEFDIQERHLNGYSKDEVLSKARDLKEKYPEKYQININNTGESTQRGVRDWYICIESNLPKNDAIMKCQKQVTYWDKPIIIAYRNLLIVVLISSFILLSIFVYWSEDFSEVIISILTCIPILYHICKELIDTFKYISQCKEIEAAEAVLDTQGSNSLDVLKNLQSKINNRRSSEFNVPSFIYRRLSYKLHKKYKRDN